MKYLIFIIFVSIISAQKSDVYFTKEISSKAIVTLYDKLNVTLTGKIGLKVHSGELDNPYFLRPEFLNDIYEHTGGTFIECNVAYPGDRSQTKTHKELLEKIGWLKNNGRFQILDEDPNQDRTYNLSNYNKINVTTVGQYLEEYDSCVVLTHFKGAPLGFGGSLKQLSIGFSTPKGKCFIHTAGVSTQDPFPLAEDDDFTASMADAASFIVNNFKNKGGIVYINVIANISINCDCDHGPAVPRIKDIGILASTDPVAIDKASLDLIRQTKDNGTEDFLNNIKEHVGENIFKYAENLGIGTTEYNLINIDEDDKDGNTFIDSPFGLIILILILFL